MQNLEAKSVTQGIPSKWQPKYLLKRIGEEDITISQETRNNILDQLAKGGKFVQIGEYTIMLNAIKGIDPMWGSKNIPPRPKLLNEVQVSEGVAKLSVANHEEIKEWESYFGDKS